MSDDGAKQPVYSRILALHHIRPGSVACFMFLEGSLAVAGLLVLAGFNIWALLVLPIAVAMAVKLNDVVAGAMARANEAASPPREVELPANRSRRDRNRGR